MKPTILPLDSFDAAADAKVLRKAFKGLGTDEAAIISVLAHRTNKQRLEVAREFKNHSGKDLVSELKSELKGAFEALCVAAVTSIPEFYARELHEAMDGIGTNEGVLAEVLGTVNNKTIHRINDAYSERYGTTLEKDIKKDTSGSFENLLIMLCQGARDESGDVNDEKVEEDAAKLYNAGEGRVGTDEETFNEILALRSYAHLRKTFDEYEKISGHDFVDAVKKEFMGSTEEGMVTLVKAIKNPAKFFAKRANEAMDGLGTKDKKLIRVVVSRAERDLGDVKEKFEEKYGKSLADAVKSETSGDYRKMLLAMIG